MTSKFGGLIFAGLILLAGGLLRATQAPTEQEVLEQERVQINSAVKKSGGTIAKELSDKFDLEPELIQKMRDSGQGWGEITILFSMADQLYKSDPKSYSTYGDALSKIRSLKSDNASYEKIAKHLDFNLSAVIDEIREIRANLLGKKRNPA